MNPLDFQHFFDPVLELSALIDVGKVSFTHVAERANNEGINNLFNRIDEVVRYEIMNTYFRKSGNSFYFYFFLSIRRNVSRNCVTFAGGRFYARHHGKDNLSPDGTESETWPEQRFQVAQHAGSWETCCALTEVITDQHDPTDNYISFQVVKFLYIRYIQMSDEWKH